MRTCLLLILLGTPLLGAVQLPSDVAAMHPEGKWKVRKADLYRYLVRFNSGQPSARTVLREYLKRRLIEHEARRRKLTVTEAEVKSWLADLDARVRRQGGQGLDDYRRKMGMKPDELGRRGRQWLLQEKVARSIFNERDPTRDKSRRLSEDSVILAVDELYRKAPKVVDPVKLPAGVVASIGGIEITEYEYGRALAYELPATEVYRAVLDLILVEEVKLLLGNDDPPTKKELAAQEEWYWTFERNRLRRQAREPDLVTDRVVRQVLEQRGLTRERILANPAFRAQARARGYFRGRLSEEDLERYFNQHQERYGDTLKLARILVVARSQRVVEVGQKVRTLQQGKRVANELWLSIRKGADFSELASRRSEDPDTIRRNGGVVPFWISAATPGYQDSYLAASRLKPGEVSKPFFSRGRGYVIVKLLERRKAPGFEAEKAKIRKDAAEQEYQLWRRKVSQAALKNEDLLGS